MKISTYLWAIEMLGLKKGDFLTSEIINEAYNKIDSSDYNGIKAKKFLLENIEAINEYNGYNLEEAESIEDEFDEEDEEHINNLLLKRNRINTIIIFLVFIFFGIIIFMILKTIGVL